MLIYREKETALDYTFHHLSPLSRSLAQGTLPPITITERLASPLYSRSITSELLFEAYQAPSVTYGVDSLFAFEGIQARRKGLLAPLAGGKKKRSGKGESAGKGESGLVIDMGHMSTTLVPVLDGKAQMNRAKRCVVALLIPFP
jgi:actin-related protein 5